MTQELQGKRILVTRAARQAASFSEAIRRQGGVPVETPVIKVQKADYKTPELLKQPVTTKKVWLVFTSANGVRFFMENMQAVSGEAVWPQHYKIAVVGVKTAEVLQNYGYQADLIPQEYVAERLAEALEAVLHPGEIVLVVRGQLSRDVIGQSLRRAGHVVYDWVIYETVKDDRYADELASVQFLQNIDIVTFTSSSTVHYFLSLIGHTQRRQLSRLVKTACIGPVTAETLQSYGQTADIVAETYSTTGLLAAIAAD